MSGGVGAQLLTAWRTSCGRRAGRHRPPNDDGHAVGQALGSRFHERTPVLKAEEAAPDAIEVDRNDRHVQPFDDPLESALERQQVARAADCAFGERCRPRGRLRSSWRARSMDSMTPARSAGGHRNRVHQAQSAAQATRLEVGLIDHEPDEALHAGADQEAVDIGDVVGHQQRRAARGDVLAADDANPVERMREQPQDESRQELGERLQHIERRGQRQHAEDGDGPRGAQAGPIVQRPAERGGQQHSGRVQEVVGGEDAAAFALRAAGLQERLQRNDEKAAARGRAGSWRRSPARTCAPSKSAGTRRPCRPRPAAPDRVRLCRPTSGPRSVLPRPMPAARPVSSRLVPRSPRPMTSLP